MNISNFISNFTNKTKLVFTTIGISIIGILSIVIKSLKRKNENLKNEKQALKAEIKNEKLCRDMEREVEKENKKLNSLTHEEIQDKWRSGK